MTAFQDRPNPPTTQEAVASAGSSGLAIGSLCTGIVGMCVPLLGLVGIGLGIWSLVRNPRAGRAMAIVGIATGALGFIVSGCLVAALVPALTQARYMARAVKSSAQMKDVVLALGRRNEELDAKGENGDLKAGDDLAALLANPVLAGSLVSPHADPDATGYVYVICDAANDFAPDSIVLMEDPNLTSRILNVAYGDGRMEMMERDEFDQLVSDFLARGCTLYHTDGRPWSSRGTAITP